MKLRQQDVGIILHALIFRMERKKSDIFQTGKCLSSSKIYYYYYFQATQKYINNETEKSVKNHHDHLSYSKDILPPSPFNFKWEKYQLT